MKIKETVLLEEGQRQTCRNYPTREFASYADCDDQYIRKRIEKIAPGMNLTPVWINESLTSDSFQVKVSNNIALKKKGVGDMLAKWQKINS